MKLGLFLWIIRIGTTKDGLWMTSNYRPTSRLGEPYQFIEITVVPPSLSERDVTQVFKSPQPHPLLEGFELNAVALGELVDDTEPLTARPIGHQDDHDTSQALLT